MKKLVGMGLVVSVLVLAHAVQAWTPPPNPDPDDILKQARADAMARRFDDAAAKHRWYHDNVLALSPSHGGVRLSFALAEWYALAERHPPAMRDFVATRDLAATRVRQRDRQSRYAMNDLISLNERLHDWKHTASVFEWLEANDPAMARTTAREAFPALVQSEAFALAVRYLDVAAWQRRDTELFASINSPPPGVDATGLRSGAEHLMDHRNAHVVLTLVKTGRASEAQAALDGLHKIVGAGVPTPLSDAALRGQMPPGALY